MKLENLERAEKLRSELKWVNEKIRNIENNKGYIDIDLYDSRSSRHDTICIIYPSKCEFAKTFIDDVLKNFVEQREKIIKEIETL